MASRHAMGVHDPRTKHLSKGFRGFEAGGPSPRRRECVCTIGLSYLAKPLRCHHHECSGHANTRIHRKNPHFVQMRTHGMSHSWLAIRTIGGRTSDLCSHASVNLFRSLPPNSTRLLRHFVQVRKSQDLDSIFRFCLAQSMSSLARVSFSISPP